MALVIVFYGGNGHRLAALQDLNIVGCQQGGIDGIIENSYQRRIRRSYLCATSCGHRAVQLGHRRLELPAKIALAHSAQRTGQQTGKQNLVTSAGF